MRRKRFSGQPPIFGDDRGRQIDRARILPRVQPRATEPGLRLAVIVARNSGLRESAVPAEGRNNENDGKASHGFLAK
jgi:hypothetical protein